VGWEKKGERERVRERERERERERVLVPLRESDLEIVTYDGSGEHCSKTKQCLLITFLHL
jgi:hypothetical protein